MVDRGCRLVQHGGKMSAREQKDWQAKRTSRWHVVMAIALSVNLVLVGFNLSYLSLRDYYLQYWPRLVALYDPIKGVSPHPDTQRYLQSVDRLAQSLGAGDDLQTETVERQLTDLQQQSTLLIAESPFLVSGKTGADAKLKQLVRQHLQLDSAGQALQQFWRRDRLQQVGWQEELGFFDRELRPLLAANFFPSLAWNGHRFDNFWKLDLGFLVLFGCDFLLGTLLASRAVADLSWPEAMLKRWYDALLFLPLWQWVRVLPTLIRLNRSRILDLGGIFTRLTQEPVAQFANRTYTFLLVRLLNQTKTAVEQENFLQALLIPKVPSNYTQVGQPDKVDLILDRLLELVALRVLPEVQPNLQQLFLYNLKGSLGESEVYQGLQQIPGIQSLPENAIDGVASYMAQTVCEGLANSYRDLESRVLLDRFTDDFKQTLRTQLLEAENQQRIQQALVDILEEIKLNYIQAIPQPDPEVTLSEADKLQLRTDEE